MRREQAAGCGRGVQAEGPRRACVRAARALRPSMHPRAHAQAFHSGGLVHRDVKPLVRAVLLLLGWGVAHGSMHPVPCAAPSCQADAPTPVPARLRLRCAEHHPCGGLKAPQGARAAGSARQHSQHLNSAAHATRRDALLATAACAPVHTTRASARGSAPSHPPAPARPPARAALSSSTWARALTCGPASTTCPTSPSWTGTTRRRSSTCCPPTRRTWPSGPRPCAWPSGARAARAREGMQGQRGAGTEAWGCAGRCAACSSALCCTPPTPHGRVRTTHAARPPPAQPPAVGAAPAGPLRLVEPG